MCMQDIQIIKSDGYCLKVNWIFVPRWDKLRLMSLNALALCPVNKTSLWFLIIPRPFPSYNTPPLQPHSYCFSCWTSPFQIFAISSMLLASWSIHEKIKLGYEYRSQTREGWIMNKLQSRGIKISWKLVSWIMNLRPNVSA